MLLVVFGINLHEYTPRTFQRSDIKHLQDRMRSTTIDNMGGLNASDTNAKHGGWMMNMSSTKGGQKNGV